ncbi:uncharacterized protein LOC123559439 isoform X1 [Mercenaria mercenaria]|uniref:uncharacterized protein LOC123559439 isoform X1 n=1 Tax=Mercenaria mercenaria TaxID=6596 RepID=UPI00234F3F8E|nr:uncharacterized protein LOC123559439 isoform X1 [Mercenaria mercenaria]
MRLTSLKQNMRGILLLFVSLLLVLCCQGEFYISTAESHWSDASSHCTMASPSDTYRPTGHLDISGIDIPDKESLWIGYYRVVRVFEYLDCVKLDDFAMDKQLKTLNIKGSPSQCFPGCGNTSIIGVTLSKCFCIGENYNEANRFKEKICTTPCVHPQGTACGLENKNGSYLSVYRVNENATRFLETVSTGKEGNNCLVFNRTCRYFEWKGCRQLFEVGCDTGHKALNVKRKSTWLEATNICFEYRLNPTSYETSKTDGNYSETSLWTGLIKSQHIHKHAEINDGVSLYGDPVFGVLTKTSKGYLVKFERDSKTRRILCQRRTPSKTENSTNTSIAIGVILAVIVVAVVFVVGISYKKRKMPKLQQKKIHTASPEYSYAEISVSNGSEEPHQPNNYYILEPHARELPTSDVTSNDVIHLNDNIADISDRRNCDRKRSNTTNEYDKLGSKHLEERRDNDSVYNRLYIRNGERGIRTDNVYNRLDIRNGV